MADAPGLAPVHPMAPGKAELVRLRAGGVPDQEITRFRQERDAQLAAGGVPPSEVQAYWGETPAQSAIVAAAMRANVQREAAYNPKLASNPLEALAAGWQMSVTGLVTRNPAYGGGGLPSVVDRPGDPSIVNAVASGLGQFAGDLPWAAGGFIGGSAAGGAATSETGPGAGFGALAGGGAGAALLPEASRQTLLLAYRAGEIPDFETFLKMSGDAAWTTAKQTALGAVTNVVGGKAGAKVIEIGGSRVLGETTDIATQVVVGGVAGAALEGRVPNARDFAAAAVIGLGIKGGQMVHGQFVPTEAGRRVIHNTQAIYEATGIPPWDVMAAAERDPALRSALTAQDVSGEPVIGPELRRRAPPVPPAPKRTQPPPVPPVEGVRPEPARLARPALPKAQGVQLFTGIMQSIEGGLGPRGEALVSPAGAIGKNQIMPATARQYMGANYDPARLFDGAENDRVMRVIVADLYDRFNGDTEAMLAGYNAGPGWGARLQRQGPGTRLEAVVDRSVRGGIRYVRVKAERNEAILPMETQKYLANARRKAGGPLPGGATAISGVRAAGGGGEGGGGGRGDGSAPAPWFEEPGRRQDGGGDGGGGEPPQPPALLGGPEDEGGGRRFDWTKADSGSIYDEIRRGIGDDGSADPTMSVSSFIAKWATELEPLRAIDHELLSEGRNLDRNRDMLLEDMGRQTYAADDIAGAMVSWGPVRHEIDAKTGRIMRTIDEDGPSVKKAAEQAREDGGNLLDWEAWMVAKRAVDLADRGIESPFNIDAARAVVDRRADSAKYERATKTLQDALDGGLDFAVDAGLISPEQKAAMKAANPIYVSFRRVAGDEDYFKTAGPKGRGTKVGKTFHKMEGGTEGQINSPVQAVIDNLRLTVKNAQRNMVAGSIVALAEGDKARADVLGLKKIAWKAAVSEAEGKPFKTYNPDGSLAADPTGPFLAERSVRGFGPNEFPFYRNGILEKWTVKDPQLAQFLRGAESPGQADVVTRSFEAIAKVQRSGITLPLDFAVRMTGIDQWMGYIYDPLHPLPFTTLFTGLMDAIKLSPVAKEWVANGGAGATITALDADYLARDMHAVFNETGVFERLQNTFKHPLEFAQIVHERLDWADRIGYYKQAKAKGIDPTKAATMSRKYKLDFAERGTGVITQWMARTVPFYRVGVLGLKQIGEGTLKNPNDPWSKAATKPAALALRSMMAVTIPVAALYALNYWQDEYGDIPEARKFKNLPQWQRDTLFITPEIAGVRMKLGMPREIGVLFGGGVNRLLDHFLRNDPHAFDDWAKNFLSLMIPPLMPPAIRAPVEGQTNYSFFSQRPLIPGSLEDASPQMQYSENTTEIAKALSRFLSDQVPGDFTDWSPIVIENYVRNFAGSVGMGALQTLDKPFNDHDRPWDVADIPFVAGFVVRTPGMSAAPIQEFYDAYGEVKRAKKDKSLAKRRENLGELEDAQATGLSTLRLERYAKVLAMQRQIIMEINGNDTMTRDEKRQMIEATYSRMIVVAKRGVELAEAVKAHKPAEPITGANNPWAPQGDQ